jgi:hypothetical protein
LINKNHLIAYDYNGEYFFSLTDINNKEIIARFGKKGQGPNEVMMMPQTLTLVGNILYFYDSNRDILFSINCNNGSNYIPQKIIDFDKNKKIMSVLPIADKKYVALGDLIMAGIYYWMKMGMKFPVILIILILKAMNFLQTCTKH